jgi:hypothetical protein
VADPHVDLVPVTTAFDGSMPLERETGFSGGRASDTGRVTTPSGLDVCVVLSHTRRPVDFGASDVRYERDSDPASTLDPIRF